MAGVNKDLFIEPETNLQAGDDDLNVAALMDKQALQKRWQTATGQSILQRWKTARYDRDKLDALVGRYYDHTDIRGIPLAGEVLEGINLSKVDFFSADLENVSFLRSNLSDSWLSESNVKGTKFDWTIMKNVIIDNVDFDHNTSFVGVDLNSINFTLATLVQDLAVGQQRITHLKQRHPNFAWFLWITCDYGRSIRRYGFWCGAVIAAFALIYYFLPGAISHTGLWDNFYFSVATFTTLGYGDIKPNAWYGRLLVIIEVTIGYIMTGLFIAILAKRVIGN